mgnify:CR=1 FL=1
MFSSTAYEALFQYIGLELHSRFIDVITSQRVFLAILIMVFATMFFMTTLQFFSRYLPGALVKRRQVPLSRYVKIVACLFIGLSILRIGTNTSVKKFNGESWHSNAYVVHKSHQVQQEYRVSFLFDVLSRSAEELSRLLNRVVDRMFKATNSELDAPSFFYKAILYAGATTLKGEDLRSSVKLYTDACVSRVLPLVGGKESLDRLDGVFRSDRDIDEKLAGLAVDSSDRHTRNCLDLKNEVRAKLGNEARKNGDEVSPLIDQYLSVTSVNDTTYQNLKMSMALVDHFMEDREAAFGIQRASQPQGGASRVFQYVNRFFSWDGLMSLFGRGAHGAALAAERSQEFSENLTRAPHVAGFIKMSLIALFPWLVFPLVAGYWRVLVWWVVAYTSVLLWAPIWTLFYHVMTGITLSSETLAAFGELSDGISLYSANLITSRMNYMYAVYSWIQLLIGAGFTGSVLWFARPILSDQVEESAPDFVGEAGRVAGGVARIM